MSNKTLSLHSPTNIITCRAGVLWKEDECPRLEEIQVEAPKAGEVRVKMVFASICHTDVLACTGFPSPLFPRVLGHEGVGLVESVGEGVEGVFLEGDTVIPTYLGECGDGCANCRSGDTNLCETYPLQAFTGLMTDATSRMSLINKQGKQQQLYHFLSCSTWSEYTVVDANYLVKIDPAIPLPHASFLSCGFTTGFGAVWKEAKVQPGSTVAVLGLGAVGLGVVEGARLAGASKIIGIDINDAKRDIAHPFGITHFINPNTTTSTISQSVKHLTGGSGVDYSFECTGVARLVNEALEATKIGIGKMIMLGAGTDKSVEIDFVTLLSCRSFKYAVFGGVKVQSDLPQIIHKCINNEIQNLDTLLTHHCPLEDINTAFQMLKEPQCVKVLINFSNPELDSLARFAVDHHNSNENELLELVRVVKAQQQVVSGTLHHLTLEVLDTGKKKKLYEAKIWVKPWINFKQVEEFKYVQDVPSFTSSDLGVKKDGEGSGGSGWKSVAVHDPVVEDAAKHAVKTIQARSNSLFPYQLSEIVHANAQVVETLAKFEMLLKLKRGDKEEKFKVEVHRNNDGAFHLNSMDMEDANH